ncbi:MAG: hypothetical protein ACR2P1_26425 [Pseudomonadales bacterium]
MSAQNDQASSLDRSNPFVGLRSFEERDAEFFLGRHSETDDLFRRVCNNKTTICFGRSGLGKTSLLLAGLFPRLRRNRSFPIHVRLDYRDSSSDLAQQVLTQTAATGRKHNIDVPEFRNDESLWEYFHRAEFWTAGFALLTPVIVFDQFEELFTLIKPHDPRRARFTEQLSDLMENRVPRADAKRLSDMEEPPFSLDDQPYNVVLSLREDFLPDLETMRSRIPSLSKNRMRLLPMNGQSAYQVVTQVEGLASPEIATQIVRFVAGNTEEQELDRLSVEPALLSIFCRELNKDRLERGLDSFSQELLDERGGQILDDFYDNTLDHYDNEAAIRVLIEEHLLTDSGRRIPIAMEDVLKRDVDINEECIDRLIDDRLIRRYERDGVVLLELTHDLLTGAIRDSRDRRRNLELEQQAEAQQDKLRKEQIRTIAWAAFAFLAVIVGAGGYWYVNNQRQVAADAKQEALAALKRAGQAETKGDLLTKSVIDLIAEVKPLIDIDSSVLDEATKEKLRKASENTKKVMGEYWVAIDDAKASVGKSNDKEVSASVQKDLNADLSSKDELKRLEAALIFARQATEEDARKQAYEVVKDAAVAVLVSDDQKKRRYAYSKLKNSLDNQLAISTMLTALREEDFITEAQSKERGVNARYMALRVLEQTNLGAWNHELIKKAGETLDFLSQSTPSLGPNSKKAIGRVWVVMRLAIINSEDRAFRRQFGAHGGLSDDDPVAIEEIVDRLEAKQFGPAGRDIALNYLLEKTDAAAWRGIPDRNPVKDMISYIDNNESTMGPSARKKATALRSKIKGFP